MNTIFNGLLIIFSTIPPVWGLLFISVLTGVIMLVLFKWSSDQNRIEKTKERMKGHLLELLLYRDDIRLSLSGLKDLLVRNLQYIFFVMKSMIFIIPPTMIILVQLAVRFESRPFHVGEKSIVSIQLDDRVDPQNVVMEAEVGVSVETHPLRILDTKQVYWRIQTEQEGTWMLRWHYDSQTVEQRVFVGTAQRKLSDRRYRMSSLGSFLNPVEKGLPRETFIRRIHIRYPGQKSHFFGIRVHWLVVFFVISLIAAFSLKGLFGVVI